MKISQLTPLVDPLQPAVDLLPIVDSSDQAMGSTGTNKKITITQLFTDPTVTGTLTSFNNEANSLTEGALWLRGGNGAIVLDNGGHKRIAWNDGINAAPANLSIRSGNYFNGTDDVYAVESGSGTTGGAAKIVMMSDGSATDGSIEFSVAPNGIAGNAISYSNSVKVWKDKFTIGSSVGIGTTTPGAKLNVVDNSANDAVRITQTGTGNALVVEDSTNPDATPFIVDNNGRVFSGHNSSQQTFGVTSRFQSCGQSNDAGYSTLRFSEDANSGLIGFSKSRSSTIGSHIIVQSGDEVGTIRFSGSDGGSFIQSASITGSIDGTPGTNDMPGRLTFSTTADGASTPTERMRINSAGNVGIGTNSPIRKLDVNGSASLGAFLFTGTGVSTGDAGIELGSLRSDSGNAILDLHAVAGVDYNGRIIRYGGINGNMDVNNTGTGNLVISQEGAGPIILRTTAIERARIASDGTVFIGNGSTSGTPNSAILSATGGGGTTPDIAGASLTIRGGIGTGTGTGGSIIFNSSPASSTTGTAANVSVQRARLLPTGQLIVGSSTTAATTRFGSVDYTPNFQILSNTSGGTTELNSSSMLIGRFGGAADGTRQFFFKSRGNAAAPTIVSTNDNIGLLSFGAYDGAKAVESARISVLVSGTPATDKVAGVITLSTTPDTTNAVPNERMRIDSAGNVGIGTTSPTYQLQLGTDSAAKPSTTAWTVSSDERLKENIEAADLDICYDAVKSIPLKRYKWKDEVYSTEQVTDRSKIGWIAQDVQAVFPKAVGQHRFVYNQVKDEDGNIISEDVIEDCLSLNADQLYATMYGAIQKLMNTVETMQARIDQLESSS